MEPEKSPSLLARTSAWLRGLRRTLSAFFVSGANWIFSRYVSFKTSLVSYYKSIEDKRQAKHEVKETNQKNHQTAPAELSIGDSSKPRATVENSEENNEVPSAPQKKKPSIKVRLWKSLWRRRRNVLSKEALTLILTAAIALAAFLQYLVYSEQAGIMRDALEQNERAIILGKGQLAVANRSAEAAQSAAQTADQTLKLTLATNRPSINIKVVNIAFSKDGGMQYIVVMVNASDVQATFFSAKCEPFMDDKRVPTEDRSLPAKPSTIAGREEGVMCIGYVPPEGMAKIKKGAAFQLYVHASYRGPTRSYSYCSKLQYEPEVNQYADIGTCDASKPFPQ